MKKIFTLVLITVNLSLHAQWEFVTQVGTSLNDVQCTSENTVFVIGDEGLIMKTTDGGQNWNSQSLGATQLLRKLQFTSDAVGYILGLSGLGTDIFKTIDGGENWNPIYSVDLIDITDISCVNEDVIYVSFEDGSLKKSIDGGSLFANVTSDSGVESIQFISENVGYASGDGGAILKTTNGGINWIEVFQVEIPTFESSIFYFVNENIGFVKSRIDLYRTTDGGETFVYLDSVDSVMLNLFAPTENILWGISVDVPLNNSSVLTMRGEVMDDGSFEKVLRWPQFRSLHFINPTLGYGVNGGGEIFKNTTGLLDLNSSTFQSSINVFPNPVADLLNISVKNGMTFHQILIYNSLGSIVFQKKYSQNEDMQVNVKSFSKGIYVLEIETDSKHFYEKIIIR